MYLYFRLLETSITKMDEVKLTLLKYSKQVALGLNYLRDKKIVHGAFKASNILVSNDDICKVK